MKSAGADLSSNGHGNVWLLRLISIPVLLIFFVSVPVATTFIAEVYFSKSNPLIELFISILAALVATVAFSIFTLFARKKSDPKFGWSVLTLIVTWELLVVINIWVLPQFNKPYTRESLAFDSIKPPTADITGVWKGSWKDPKKKIKQDITLHLDQSGNAVSGSIHSPTTAFSVIEGVISGNELNLFYDKDPRGFRSRGATLKAKLQGNTLRGKYFAHERPRLGWASSGPWSANFDEYASVPLSDRIIGSWTGTWIDTQTGFQDEIIIEIKGLSEYPAGTILSSNGTIYTVTKIDLDGNKISLSYKSSNQLENAKEARLEGVLDNEGQNASGKHSPDLVSANGESLHLPWRITRKTGLRIKEVR